MAEFLARLVVDKGARPGDDMLSAIVKASEDGDTLSANEATSMAFLLLVAGHETTVNLIGNGALALLRHPDQLALLRADPGLVPNAVEEFLRFDGPVNLATFRYTVEPVEIGGTTIPEGEVVRSRWSRPTAIPIIMARRRDWTSRATRAGTSPSATAYTTPGRPAGPTRGRDRVPHPARPLPGPRPRR